MTRLKSMPENLLELLAPPVSGSIRRYVLKGLDVRAGGRYWVWRELEARLR